MHLLPKANHYRAFRDTWIDALGLVGLYLFGLGAFLSTAGANIGIALMLITAVFHLWRSGPDSRWQWHPLLYVAICASVAVLASALRSMIEEPSRFAAVSEGTSDLLKLWLFVLVAWSLRGRQAQIPAVLGLALIGFVIGSLRALDEASLAALVKLQRPDFRWSINAIAQYAAAGLLGLSILMPRLWRSVSLTKWRYLGIAAWLALFALLSATLALAQSRTAFLGLAIVVVGVAIHAGRLKSQAGSRLVIPRPGVLGLLLLGALGLTGIFERFEFLSWQNIDAWSYTEFARTRDVSIDVRTALLRLGVDLWLERPLLGWGPGTSGLLINAASQSNPLIAGMPDFHNLFVDLLVSIGLLGSIAYALGFLIVMRAVREAYRQGCLQQDVYLLLFWLLIFELLSQVTSYRIDSYHGRFFWMLVGGAAYCCRFSAAVKSSA